MNSNKDREGLKVDGPGSIIFVKIMVAILAIWLVLVVVWLITDRNDFFISKTEIENVEAIYPRQQLETTQKELEEAKAEAAAAQEELTKLKALTPQTPAAE